jgi:hypothetical protein
MTKKVSSTEGGASKPAPRGQDERGTLNPPEKGALPGGDVEVPVARIVALLLREPLDARGLRLRGTVQQRQMAARLDGPEVEEMQPRTGESGPKGNR